MLDQRNNSRAHYIHRISYSTQERIVGTFVLLAVAILLWLLFSSGQTKHLFEEQLTFYGELATNKAVNKDTEIQISGLSVGTVTSVDVNDFSQIILTMKILKKYHNLLRTDSTATLTSPELAVLGNTVIEITPGNPALPLLVDGSTLRIKEAASLQNIMDKVEPIFTALGSSINKMDSILAGIDPVMLNQTLENMNAATRNMREVSEQVTSGDGMARNLIYDEEFKQQIEATVSNLQEASLKINQLLDTINEQAEVVPELLDQVDPLLKEADRTLKAAQRIWPLSTAVGDKADSANTSIAPEVANE